MRTGSIKYLALMGVVLSSCNQPSVQPATEAQPTAQGLDLVADSQTNPSAGIACSVFRKTMNEVSKGLIAGGQLEQRIGSVYERARLGTLNSGSAKPPDDFESSAEEMLRSIIENNHKSFVSAADRFSKACKSRSF